MKKHTHNIYILIYIYIYTYTGQCMSRCIFGCMSVAFSLECGKRNVEGFLGGAKFFWAVLLAFLRCLSKSPLWPPRHEEEEEDYPFDEDTMLDRQHRSL